jgi:transposase InsO family protein
LREAGWTVSTNTVAAVMREQGLAARRKKKRRSATRPGKGRWRAPDLVRRDFPAKQVNRKWYGDGTEIPTGEGKLYLASVVDMASRRCSGSRSASITTRPWPTAHWSWRWRYAAAGSRA